MIFRKLKRALFRGLDTCPQKFLVARLNAESELGWTGHSMVGDLGAE